MEENNHEIDISLEDENSDSLPAQNTGMQSPQPPAAQQPAGSAGDKPGIDPKSFILPKKEVHTLDSAQRVNAGELYEKEQSAELPKAPPAPPLPKVERNFEDTVEPLETYQSDIQRYVQEKNVTAVTVAAAEADRKARILAEAPKAPEKIEAEGAHEHRMLEISAFIGGLVILLSALGVFGYAYFTTRSLPTPQTPQAPFIVVDGSADIPVSTTDSKQALMQTLVDAKDKVHLPFSLIGALRPVTATPSGNVPLSAQVFLSMLAPDIPSELLRSLQPQFLLGVHSFTNNEPLLILSVDSYETGYAGMLKWEKTMQQDLLPLFAYHPSPHPNITPVGTITPPQGIIQSGFVDTIVENHDARAIIDQYGQIELLWLFLDRSTILITTNPDTVHEIISRLKTSPTLTLPGQ